MVLYTWIINLFPYSCYFYFLDFSSTSEQIGVFIMVLKKKKARD